MTKPRYTVIPFSSVVGSGVWDSEEQAPMVFVLNLGSEKETLALANICADAINAHWSGKRKPDAD